MLHIATTLRDLDFPQLMDIYIEGNMEKVQEGLSLPEAEQMFRQYLAEVFFTVSEAVYYVWLEKGKYLSALRLEPYRDGLLLEALETAPEQRGKGYGSALLQAVLETAGQVKIYSHVGKRNLASLRIHEKHGFRRISDTAVYIDGSVNDRAYTLCFEQKRKCELSEKR